MLPPLASEIDLESRIPGGFPQGDTTRAVAALQDASALIREEAGKTWVDDNDELEDVPDIVAAITMAVARRAILNPEGIRSEQLDGYSVSLSSSSPDVYLTASERRLVRKAAGKSGISVLTTTRLEDDVPELDTVYLDVEPEGEPIPWGAKGDAGVS